MARGKKSKVEIEFAAKTKGFDENIKNTEKAMTSLRKELKLNATELKGDSDNMQLLSQRAELLSKESQASQDKISSLNKKLEEAKSTLGEDSEQVRILSNKLVDAKTQFAGIQNEIKQTSNKLDVLENSADTSGKELKNLSDDTKLAESGLKDTSKAAENMDGGFTVAKGAAANLVSEGLKKIVEWAKSGISYLAGLADETREFRQDMNTLTTAYDEAGFSSAQATETWKNLYSVFGEDDRAVEAANNISRMSKSQQELDNWVRITTGIWGTYQDALPVESLAEAAGETAKTGQVTGALADALNWNSEAAKMFSKYMSEDVTTAEDAFNVALSKCSDEQERQSLITDTLSQLYGTAADKYRETAGSIMDANSASAEFETAQAALGEKVEPVTTTVKSGFTGILDKLIELTDSVDFKGLQEDIELGFGEFTDNILPGILDGLQWVLDNKDMIISGVSGIGAAFAVWKAASIISAVTGALKGMSAAQVLAAAKQWLLNTALFANPIGLVIAAIAGLVTAFVVLWKKSDKFREFWKGLWKGIKETGSNAVTSIKKFFTSLGDSIGNVFQKIRNKIKVPKIEITYSSDGTLGKVAQALGLQGFPKLHIRWNKYGALFTGKTVTLNGYAEAGDDEYALPLNKRTLDPLAAGVVSHMNDESFSEIGSKLDHIYSEIAAGNSTLVDKIVDAVSNRIIWKLDRREVGRAIRSI